MLWGDSPYGAADMAGNVREWVADYYSAEGYADLASIDPMRDSPHKRDKRRSVRGGSWMQPRIWSLSYYRDGLPPERRDKTLGFRCAR